MAKQLRDESFAIDDELKRIHHEHQSFKPIDQELDKDYEDYNAQVRAANSKGGGNDEDIRRLRQTKAEIDAKEANLIERKRRLLYDVDEVNKRARDFNEKGIKTGLAPKSVLTLKIFSNDEPLQPKPYKKGEPLPSVSVVAQKSSPAGSRSPGPASDLGGVEPDVADLVTEIARDHPSYTAADFRREFEDTLGRSPNVAECKLFKRRQEGGGGGGGGGKGPQVISRGGGGGNGGLLSQPSADPVQEGKLIDQEWARIEKEKGRLAGGGQYLNDENDKLNARIREVNDMKTDNTKQLAEVRAWGKRLDDEEEAMVVDRRHLLYDIQILNNRVITYNESISRRQDLDPKPTLEFTYVHNNAKLTPLPY